MNMKKIVCIILGFIIVTVSNVSNATYCGIEKININDFPKNSITTRAKTFVANIGLEDL